MTTYIVPLTLLAGGILLLVIGANLLIRGSVSIAMRVGISPLLVGLTIVAWGTSAPELAFNLIAAWQDKTALVIGNTVGANICNLALILGVCAVMRPLTVHDSLIRFELPVMIGLFVALLAVALLPEVGLTGGLGRGEGVALLAIFGFYSATSIRTAMREREAHVALAEEVTQDQLPDKALGVPAAVLMILGGLALLGGGGAMAAEGATGLAFAAGMSERVVAVTVVSLGTTLPELITALMAVRAKHVDLAVGNVVGSALFNVGAILPLAMLVSPAGLPEGALSSIIVLTGLAMIVWPICVTHDQRIARFEGVILLVIYAAFVMLELAQSGGM